MVTKRIDFAIPLQSNCSTDEPSSLPSSPKAADADLVMELPYVTPSYSLAIQSKRALAVRNALVASKSASSLAAAGRVFRYGRLLTPYLPYTCLCSVGMHCRGALASD